MKLTHMTPQFVEFIPETLEHGVLYVSQRYATAVHKCCCGCDHEVVTPLTPTDWSLAFDGKFVSLAPSVGNWSLPCRSHYVIRKNQVLWAGAMSERQINKGRAFDRAEKIAYFNKVKESKSTKHPSSVPMPPHDKKKVTKPSFWSTLIRWWQS